MLFKVLAPVMLVKGTRSLFNIIAVLYFELLSLVRIIFVTAVYISTKYLGNVSSYT